MVFVRLRNIRQFESRIRASITGEELHLTDLDEPSATAREAFGQSEVAFGIVTPSWIPEAKRLRWLQHLGVGVDALRVLDWKTLSTRVTVTNMPGFYADPVAQTILAGLLGRVRGLVPLRLNQEKRIWDPTLRFTLETLTGKTVLLAGYGSIARRLAELLAPFRCTLTTFARSNPEADLHTSAAVDRILPETDIVVSTLPATPATDRFFDAGRFARFKRGSIFVNAGRGETVDEQALVSLLCSGHLGGAVLDVARTEPPATDSPLWGAPNLCLTQHTGGGWNGEQEARVDWFLDNLRRFRTGVRLNGIVDWERGY